MNKHSCDWDVTSETEERFGHRQVDELHQSKPVTTDSADQNLGRPSAGSGLRSLLQEGSEGHKHQTVHLWVCTFYGYSWLTFSAKFIIFCMWRGRGLHTISFLVVFGISLMFLTVSLLLNINLFAAAAWIVFYCGRKVQSVSGILACDQSPLTRFEMQQTGITKLEYQWVCSIDFLNLFSFIQISSALHCGVVVSTLTSQRESPSSNLSWVLTVWSVDVLLVLLYSPPQSKNKLHICRLRSGPATDRHRLLSHTNAWVWFHVSKQMFSYCCNGLF